MKKEKFIEEIEKFLATGQLTLSEDALVYFESLKNSKDSKNGGLTENGKAIITYLQNHPEIDAAYAKDIAAGMGIAGKTVAGSMRKLVADGLVEKLGDSPIKYALTTKGKEFTI